MNQYAIMVEGKEIARFDSLEFAEQYARGYNDYAEDNGPPYCEIVEVKE